MKLSFSPNRFGRDARLHLNTVCEGGFDSSTLLCLKPHFTLLCSLGQYKESGRRHKRAHQDIDTAKGQNMLRPKKRAIQRDRSGSSIDSEDAGDFDSSSVCYDAMSPSNVTVSLQPKSLRLPASRHASANHAATAKSLGSGSAGNPSFGSISTAASQPQSLAASIGSFDADKVQTEEKKALVRARSYVGAPTSAKNRQLRRARVF